MVFKEANRRTGVGAPAIGVKVIDFKWVFQWKADENEYMRGTKLGFTGEAACRGANDIRLHSFFYN